LPHYEEAFGASTGERFELAQTWAQYMAGSVRTVVDVSLKPKQAFRTFFEELSLGLEAHGMKIVSRALGSRIMEGKVEVGTVDEWSPGERVSLVWHPKSWESGVAGRIRISFDASKSGTRVTLESSGWGEVVGDGGYELLGWFAGEVVAPLLSASSPGRFGDWMTDRRARKPSGPRSRRFYANPVYHWPNFLAIFDVLQLRPDDNLVEVGCGGGAFLHEALRSGCKASAIDHSPDMVRLAMKSNRSSVAAGRLRVELGDAEELPYPSGAFTCAVMTGVLPFVPKPADAFSEVFRVLRSGGRFVVFTGSKEERGTPAVPEPLASRIHFYEDRELTDLARGAGFSEAVVEHPSLYEFAKKAGVPKADLEMFRSASGSQLLVCRKA
jgi:ubiquinone/menaquinone biosynthesis C-methylase UbiE